MEIDSAMRTDVLNRLKRARGQIDGIIGMMDDERSCTDVVTQIAAVSKAVDRAGFVTISTGLKACIADPEHNPVDAAKLEKLFLSLA